MKTTQANYVEWLNAEQMHEASKEWLSELEFVKDEHTFFEDLITKFTSELLEFGDFSDKIEIIDAINRSEKQNNSLIEAIKTHENGLQIMIDGIDQIEKEKAYTKAHRDLIIAIADYLKEYKSLKKQLFNIIKNIKKEEKQRSLIDKR
jgi:hypothetical protein